MSSDNEKKLEFTLAGIRRIWGTQAIVPLSQKQAASFSHISTSFPALDSALGIGGLPRGRMTELAGSPTSGVATLALKTIANAQLNGGTAVYLDIAHTFDPDYAHRCGVNLRQLLLIHPYSPKQAVAMLPDFIINGGLDIFIVDIPLTESLPSLNQTLGRLIAPLSKTDCALLFLTTLPPQIASNPHDETAVLPHFAAVRLQLYKSRWLYQRGDVLGYEADVHILKNKFHPPGQVINIAITFNGIVQGDGT